MYTAQFSEFSYGYAITDNILHSGLPMTASAPVFPSLLQEGSVGGGYDVQIPLHPVAIFLQFKIPQVVRRRSIKMPVGFTKPYLRMHLRTKRPNQHQLLLDLEAAGEVVLYATPDFWLTRDLDTHFVAGSVPLQSRYFAPSEIGSLDAKPHQVAYCTNIHDVWVFSEPQKLRGEFGAEAFGARITKAVQFARPREPLAFFNDLSSSIANLTRSRRAQSPPPRADDAAVGRKRPREEERAVVVKAAREAAYLAHVRLGCALIVAGR